LADDQLNALQQALDATDNSFAAMRALVSSVRQRGETLRRMADLLIRLCDDLESQSDGPPTPLTKN
jgi:fumarate hydratase class II